VQNLILVNKAAAMFSTHIDEVILWAVKIDKTATGLDSF
jgi:hypothetical protein